MAGGHKTREQEPVSITKADIQQQVSGMKSRTAPGPDVSPVCRLKKLTALLDHLTGQTGGWLWRIHTKVHMCCSKNTKTDGIRNRKRNYHGWPSPWTTQALLLTSLTLSCTRPCLPLVFSRYWPLYTGNTLELQFWDTLSNRYTFCSSITAYYTPPTNRNDEEITELLIWCTMIQIFRFTRQWCLHMSLMSNEWNMVISF